MNLRDVRALVVEDDPANARLMVGLLDTEGCDVRVAHSAEEALVVLEAFRARVIVLNLVLPRMSGLVLATRLKENPATRDVLIIGVSSFDAPSTERLAISAGCDAYIGKPFGTDTFGATIRRLLTERS